MWLCVSKEKVVNEHQESGSEMSKSAAERDARGHAGEFRVASELCRRNMFAILTMGNVPNFDTL